MGISRPIDLNILPARYRRRRIRFTQVVTFLLVCLLLAGIVPAYRELLAARIQTANARVRVDQAKAVLMEDQVDLEEITGVEREIEQIRTSASRLRAESGAIGQRHAPRSEGVAAAVSALVPRVGITTISQEGSSFIVSGTAGSQALVLDYARALQSAEQFTSARILSMVNADSLGISPDVQFVIEAG